MRTGRWKRKMAESGGQRAGKYDTLRAMKFEDNFKSLEDTVRRMESGELSLDEMIASFEKGRKLATECQKELESIRLKIEKVTSSGAQAVKIVENEAGAKDIEI